MIDFPASPNVGAIFTAGSQQWTWDGVKWLPSGLGAAQIVPAMNDNRIINGDCRIDQRNNGSSGTAYGYTLDRWIVNGSVTGKGTWQQANMAAGFSFSKAFSFTSSSAYTLAAGDYFFVQQIIEADMVTDFGWGASYAPQPVTLSFWANSSLAGTHSGNIANGANTVSYPFTYTLSANTWTKIAITIPSTTSGSWSLIGNGKGVIVSFNLGTGTTYSGPANAWANTWYNAATGAVSIVSTNGATFYVTGVKLEIGSIATPFNRQSLAKSLADCQRYYEAGSMAVFNGQVTSGTAYYAPITFRVNKRAVPTMTGVDAGVTNFPAGAPTFGSVYVDCSAPSKIASATGFGSYFFSWTASAEL